MLCDQCGENEANVHLTHVAQGVVKKMHLCEDCAANSGINLEETLSVNDFLLGMGVENAPRKEAEKECPGCGLKRSDFRKISLLGCPKCYDTFASELARFLKAMQKGATHKGKIPSQRAAELRGRIDELHRALAAAVSAEKFEEAASLRDEIRRIEAARGPERQRP